MKIELLYFEGCPGWEKAFRNLKKVLEEEGHQDYVELIRVEDRKDAKKHDFPGSPTVRINGIDVSGKKTEGHCLGCRTYRYLGDVYSYPPKEMIRGFLKELKS